MSEIKRINVGKRMSDAAVLPGHIATRIGEPLRVGSGRQLAQASGMGREVARRPTHATAGQIEQPTLHQRQPLAPLERLQGIGGCDR